MAKTEVIKGTVKAVNQKQTGLTFGNVGPDGKDVWYTFTKEEWREPGFYIPSKGDTVETIIKDDTFVISCLPMRNGADIVPPPESFYGPPDEVYERDINADVPTRPRNEEQRSIQASTAIKYATEIVVAFVASGYLPDNYTPVNAAADVAAMAATIATVYSE